MSFNAHTTKERLWTSKNWWIFFVIGSMTRSFDNQLEREAGGGGGGGDLNDFLVFVLVCLFVSLNPSCKRWTMKAKGRGSGAEGRGRGHGGGGGGGGWWLFTTIVPVLSLCTFCALVKLFTPRRENVCASTLRLARAIPLYPQRETERDTQREEGWNREGGGGGEERGGGGWGGGGEKMPVYS